MIRPGQRIRCVYLHHMLLELDGFPLHWRGFILREGDSNGYVGRGSSGHGLHIVGRHLEFLDEMLGLLGAT